MTKIYQYLYMLSFFKSFKKKSRSKSHSFINNFQLKGIQGTRKASVNSSRKNSSKNKPGTNLNSIKMDKYDKCSHNRRDYINSVGNNLEIHFLKKYIKCILKNYNRKNLLNESDLNVLKENKFRISNFYDKDIETYGKLLDLIEYSS